MQDPVPTTITGWNMGSYGIWGLLILQLVAFTTVLVRNGPKWLETWASNRRMAAEDDLAERAALAAEKAAEKAEEAADLARFGHRIDTLEDRVTRMGQALSFLMNAAITSTNALEQAAPGSPAVKQSRDLIALAASAIGAEDPFGKALAQLATVRSLGE